MKKIEVKHDEKALKEELSGLLYRKAMIEQGNVRLSKGASVYVNYCEVIKKRIKLFLNPKAIERLKLEVELLEYRHKADGIIVSLKQNEREYKDYLIPQVEEVTKKLKMDTKDIEFIDILKASGDLVKTEMYGAVQILPSNLELSTIMKSYRKHIAILNTLSDATYEKWEKEKDALAKAQMEKNMYEYNLQIENLEKRVNKRNAYYTDVFLPMYNADMKERELYLDKYLKRAEQLAKTGIDKKLTHMLDLNNQIAKNKEEAWLFYTALRNRVEEIMKAMRKDGNRFNDKLHLMTPIRDKAS